MNTTRFTYKHGSAPYLGENNYNEWSIDMEMMLSGANVFDIVDGSEPPPPATAGASRQNEYLKRERLAASLIWASLTSTARQLISAQRQDPEAMWNTLKERLNVALNDVSAARIRDQF